MTKTIAVHAGTLLLLVPLAGCGAEEPPAPTAEATALPAPEPEPEVTVPGPEEPAAAPEPTPTPTYVVQAGDHLWGIAGRQPIYDASRYWPLLYDGNRERIEDPDLIYAGQELDIPRFESEAQRRERLFELWGEMDDAG